MDIKIEKKPWYIRHRYYLLGGTAFVIFLIYVISLSFGPRKLRIETDNIQIAEVKNDKFMEYVDVEGLVQPILTIKINTREAGSVERIIGEEGTMMEKGDSILVLSNPDLLRSIEDQRDEWEKQRITYKEKEIEMEQKSLTLKQQTLQTQYEMNRLTKSFALDKEEYKMGIKSKAQLEVSEDEYNYKLQNSALQMESLRHDSAVTLIRKDLLKNDLEREQKKFTRSLERMNNLVVTAPIAGQLSFVKVTPGQQVASGESIAEIKVLDQYYYICVVLDLFSRRILSYSISDSINTALTLAAFDDAFQSRNPPQDLMFHSDQGAQYTSYIFRAHLKELHIKQSFSTPGTPYDNSVCESFFHTLKKEALYHHLYGTPQELQAVLDEYINFYNSQRPHRKLNMKTPNQYESAFYSGCL